MFPRVGAWAWSFIGCVIAGGLIVFGLVAASDVVLPVICAIILAVMFKPLTDRLQRHGFPAALAAGVVVVGLVILIAGILAATAHGIVGQAGVISEKVTGAIQESSEQAGSLGVSTAALDSLRAELQKSLPVLFKGAAAGVVDGLRSVIGLASGLVLGLLVMYYFLKDGAMLRGAFIGNFTGRRQREINAYIGESCQVLRDYARGRTILSVIIALIIGLGALVLGLPLVFTIIIVNFIGGYIPYIGAFLGGSLAVIIALGESGIPKALVMLGIILAANIILENFISPKVMGNTLDIHPVVVLVVTALGGVLGGIAGLILAVPFYALAANGVDRLRRLNAS